MLRYLYTSLFSLILLAGCVPIPTKVNRMPSIQGDISADGNPLANVPVKLCTYFYGETNCMETTTNSRGTFYLARKSKLGFVSLGAPLHSYKLSIQQNSQKLDWTYERMGQIPSDATINCTVSEELNCEFHAPW